MIPGDTVIYNPKAKSDYAGHTARVEWVSRDAQGKELAVGLVFANGKKVWTMREFVTASSEFTVQSAQ